MRITSIRRILKEDLSKSGELPGWVDLFIQPLNDFLEQVTSALRNRLTFADNFQCEQKLFRFTSGTALEISTTARIRVSGVILLEAVGKVVESQGFTRLSNGNLQMTITVTGGGSFDAVVLILLG